jgi:pyruvate dehydrogenase E1 component
LHDQIPEESLAPGTEPPYYRPPEDSDEYRYMMDRRKALDGAMPRRVVTIKRPLELPKADVFGEFDTGSGKQEASTTMAFTRLLRNLARDKKFGPRVVPIIPDEARTFGMDALFREFKIYASQGQKYDPVDAQLLLSYAESKDGQLLEEGITEAGSGSSFTAAGTAYATRGVPMVPFFIFYSMFGFQRVGDLLWAAADSRARGFLLGATAGRTTLLGEGLQHQDGHSHLLASVVPSCEAYDPAFAYEMAAIIRRGIDRMYGVDALSPGNAVYYYLTLYNENYVQPAKPDVKDIDEQIVSGLYKWADAPKGPKRRATILFSGSAQGAARQAQADLAEHFDVAAELWSVTSYKKLREEAMSAERWNRLHPGDKPRTPYVSTKLASTKGPIVAVTDYLKAVPDQIAKWIPDDRRYLTLGTDGFGRSDTREALRRFFETDAGHIAVAALAGLAENGEVTSDDVEKVIAHYQIDTEAPDPRDS